MMCAPACVERHLTPHLTAPAQLDKTRRHVEELEACERVVSFQDLRQIKGSGGALPFGATLFFLRDKDACAAQEVDAARGSAGDGCAPDDEATAGSPPAKRARRVPSDGGGVHYATSRAVQVEIECVPNAGSPHYLLVRLLRALLVLA